MNGFFAPSSTPRVLGHRGAPTHFQENTLAGFRKAKDLGAQGIELDVFMTRDEKVVVFHDEETERLTGEKNRITDMTWDEVSRLSIQKSIDRGDGTHVKYSGEHKIPLLEEVIWELPDDFLINIEMKAYTLDWSRRHTGTHVAEIIKNTGAHNRVIVTSFDFFMLEYLERNCPEIHSGFAYDGSMLGGLGEWLNRFDFQQDSEAQRTVSDNLLNMLLRGNTVGQFIQSTVVDAQHTLLDSETVTAFHNRNMLVGAYTLFPEDRRYSDFRSQNSDEEALRVASAGVDWIECDDIARLLEILSHERHNDHLPNNYINNVV
ncbi:glycerophosphodiester phosphodiesterase [Endozoicomonas arenosclerae]|uniref:glycerophosphodiester phosphodiesterase n=1 Tax=Endozoicomonas arenosclerae TaxID=1633495 RepID=UPI000782781E|nr:glycerophosphodiester phosphodiesterase family protein [Endozoicomonas arenosclerae]